VLRKRAQVVRERDTSCPDGRKSNEKVAGSGVSSRS
jgi:hypothetical protein